MCDLRRDPETGAIHGAAHDHGPDVICGIAEVIRTDLPGVSVTPEGESANSGVDPLLLPRMAFVDQLAADP